MQSSSEAEKVLERMKYLVGSAEQIKQLPQVSALEPYDESVVDFLNDVSKNLMKNPESKLYPDVITFGFWIRKANILKLKERIDSSEGIRLGRGVVFHIAPSNVPVNFAYSLVSGLICGNANVVRVPSKDYPQVKLITDSINIVLAEHKAMASYVICARYERDKDINDLLSSLADVRVVWGGDQTIAELRKSPLQPRAGEITFADRYSLAVIDSDAYMDIDDKAKVALDFYNDTFLTDQNACTSPRMIVWLGNRIEEAKKVFWEKEHSLVKQKYVFQSIQGVNKLTRGYMIAAKQDGVMIEKHSDNLIIRVRVPRITDYLMNYRDNSGYFYEYDCSDLMEMFPIVNDKHCQTIAYIGDKNMFIPIIQAGVKGIDRVVPIGKTMDFDLIWDGYRLVDWLSKTIMFT